MPGYAGSLGGASGASAALPANPYGSLAGVTPESFQGDRGTLNILYPNAPLPPQRPSPLVLSGNQGGAGGGDTQPSPAPAPPAAPAPSPAPQAAPQAPSGNVWGHPMDTTSGVFTSSPFDTKDPNSFLSRIFGQKSATQMPLVQPNSIVGRLAHLFM